MAIGMPQDKPGLFKQCSFAIVESDQINEKVTAEVRHSPEELYSFLTFGSYKNSFNFTKESLLYTSSTGTLSHSKASPTSSPQRLTFPNMTLLATLIYPWSGRSGFAHR